MDVGIVAQKGNERAAGLADEIRRTLRAEGVDVLVDEATAAHLPVDGVSVDRMRERDLVVSIGGDGTFLYAARGAGSTPIMGVNLGEVGFLNAVSPAEAVDAVTDAVDRLRETGEVRYREVPRLRAEGEDWSLEPAINEVVVQGEQRGPGSGAEIAVEVDGATYTEGHADGVIVATQTGSTAYNLSEDGPLVRPDLDALVITEMCAADGMPPLVASEDCEVTVRVADAPAGYAISDGRTQRRLDPPETVRITTAGRPVRLAGPTVDFFEALEKLD
ncbi:NAD(+)/NADH kinase [Halostella sp. JP-L12]|uniref:NAD(+)/NADH kinase n=1 Tax=Halostella TaxID=1843185 RepID=UPI000EF7905B|nr:MULTISPECIES: NAD(+)/NADH kinase [Halostella]NHN46973.1 NAD(+)/NADH kinase [Halostella sp. JP-L12]